MQFVHPQTEPIGNPCFPMDIQKEQDGHEEEGFEDIIENLKKMKF